MPRALFVLALLPAMLCLSAPLQAAPCDRLSAKQRQQAQQLQRAVHPYACCDETLERCLRQRRVCKLAKRLRDAICRRLVAGQDVGAIRSALERRARSMTPVIKPAAIDLSQAPAAGAAAAPVTVVAYACSRCPFCSKVLPELYRMVTSGALKGRVKLYYRPFPIRSHAGSVPGGLALVAAEHLGKLWPFLIYLYGHFDQFSADKLPGWAARVGLDRGAFVNQMGADPLSRHQTGAISGC